MKAKTLGEIEADRGNISYEITQLLKEENNVGISLEKLTIDEIVVLIQVINSEIVLKLKNRLRYF